MKSNLLSVFKCYKDNHCRFIFDASAVTIQDIPSGKVLYMGRNEVGLYPIYGAPFSHKSSSTPLNSNYFCSPSVKTACVGVRASSSTWHSRLGHPNAKILKSVLPTLPSHNVASLDSNTSNSFYKHCLRQDDTITLFSFLYQIYCTSSTRA